MDMIWQEYQRRGVRRRSSECIFHELQSSPVKILDMMFQFQRRKRAPRAREANVWKQTREITCKSTHTDISTTLITRPKVAFDQPSDSLLAICLGSCSKKEELQMWTSSHFLLYFHWCLNIWWAVALLQLLILNKSEGWVSLRVAFFHFFHHSSSDCWSHK